MKPSEGAYGPEEVSRDDLSVQVIWYAVVGAVSFLADICVFFFLLNMGAPVFPTLVIGFIVGAVTNYFLCRWLAFQGGRFRQANEVLRLVVVALIGLGITAGIFAVLMQFGFSAMVSKIIATVIAFAWNFLGRRFFVFYSNMPEGTWLLSNRILRQTFKR